MTVVAIILQMLLALAFLFSGGRKLANSKASQTRRDHLHVAPWFWWVTGLIEVLATIGLLVGIWLTPLAFLAALVLAATMIGAVFTQLVNTQPFRQAAPAVVLLVLALVVALAHWPDVTHLPG